MWPSALSNPFPPFLFLSPHGPFRCRGQIQGRSGSKRRRGLPIRRGWSIGSGICVSMRTASSSSDVSSWSCSKRWPANRPSSPMDVMMKSSLGIRSLRIVERPYDVLVTDSTPGKECTPSATYGLGHIPDKGRSYHSAGKPRIEACPNPNQSEPRTEANQKKEKRELGRGTRASST